MVLNVVINRLQTYGGKDLFLFNMHMKKYSLVFIHKIGQIFVAKFVNPMLNHL